MRRTALRASLGLALVFATGCTRDTDFDLKKTFRVHPTPAGGLTYSDTQTVDLSAEAGAAWDHRDKLKSVKVGLATAVARNVTPASGTTGFGSAALLPDGGAPAIPIGSWGDPTPIAIVDGAWIETTGSDALNAALNAALEGSGVLSFQVAGGASQEFEADIDVTLHVTVEYSVSPL